MHNLLTEDTKKQITREYQFRFLSLLFTFFSVIFLIGAVLLLPAYIFVYSEKGELELELQVIKDKQKEKNENTNFSASARSVEEKIKILSDFGTKGEKPSSLFEKIIEEKGSTITFQQFSYSLPEGRAEITLNGEAKNRDELIAFRNRLRKKAPFTAADFPVELLAKEENIRFSINIRQ